MANLGRGSVDPFLGPPPWTSPSLDLPALDVPRTSSLPRLSADLPSSQTLPSPDPPFPTPSKISCLFNLVSFFRGVLLVVWAFSYEKIVHNRW